MGGAQPVATGPDWRWLEIPVAPLAPEDAARSLRLSPRDGATDIDVAYFAVGAWMPPAAGASLKIPPARLFHGGWSRTADGAVVLERERDAQGQSLEGPGLPLPPGRYRLDFECASPAAAGTKLGEWQLDTAPGQPVVAAVAGRPCPPLEFVQAADLPFSFSFRYLRAADMEILRITLTRVE